VPPPQDRPHKSALHERIRDLQGYIPDDGHTVAVAANITHKLDWGPTWENWQNAAANVDGRGRLATAEAQKRRGLAAAQPAGSLRHQVQPRTTLSAIGRPRYPPMTNRERLLYRC